MSVSLYRLRAEDCRRLAECASDPAKKAEFLSLGRQWSRLATEVELRQMELWGVCERSDPTDGFGPVRSPPAGAHRQH